MTKKSLPQDANDSLETTDEWIDDIVRMNKEAEVSNEAIQNKLDKDIETIVQEIEMSGEQLVSLVESLDEGDEAGEV